MNASPCKFDWLEGERGKLLGCVIHAKHSRQSTIAVIPGFETLADLARQGRLMGAALEDARQAAREERAFARSIRELAEEDHLRGRAAFTPGAKISSRKSPDGPKVEPRGERSKEGLGAVRQSHAVERTG